jgi:oxygen-independent coproporphyrinogen-3 oxidase
VKYWTGEDYLGFGVAAHSFFAGERFANSRDIKGYILGESIECERRKISRAEQMSEYVMLRMRLSKGVSRSEFSLRFGESFDLLYGYKLKKYTEGGFIVDNGDNIFFSDKGFFVSNYILSDILDFG